MGVLKRAVKDYRLYSGTKKCKPLRHDAPTYEALYGLHPKMVQSISECFTTLKIARLTRSGHRPTIDVLDFYASVFSSDRKVGSAKFYKLFADFVERFKRSGCGVSYLDGNPTDVTHAY